jgi:nucleotide-binding universal stress UspA family protein
LAAVAPDEHVRYGRPALDWRAGRTLDELVVVGRRGRGQLAAALLGSVSLKIINEAPCPVLVVR